MLAESAERLRAHIAHEFGHSTPGATRRDRSPGGICPESSPPGVAPEGLNHLPAPRRKESVALVRTENFARDRSCLNGERAAAGVMGSRSVAE